MKPLAPEELNKEIKTYQKWATDTFLHNPTPEDRESRARKALGLVGAVETYGPWERDASKSDLANNGPHWRTRYFIRKDVLWRLSAGAPCYKAILEGHQKRLKRGNNATV